MERIHVYLFFLVLTAWTYITTGLQCPTCLHVTTSEDAPAIIQAALSTNPLLKMFNDTKCLSEEENRKSEIAMGQCEKMQGKFAQCGYYSGFVYLKILGLAASVPIKLHQRGCYYFSPADVRQSGCHYRKNEEEDLNLVKKTLEIAASQGNKYTLDSAVVLNIEGDLCLPAGSTTAVTPISLVNEGSDVSKEVMPRCVLFFVYMFIFT